MAGDWQPPLRLSGVANAAGSSTLTVRPRSARTMDVDQVTVTCTPRGTARCWVYLNGAPVCPLVATGDAAGGAPSIHVEPTDEMTIVFTGLSAGDSTTATVFYGLL